ncbi:MAG: nucleotidyltransferase domain-containing protein [Candidatus Micrarchaeota archaeon]
MGGTTNLVPLITFFKSISGKLGLQRVILFGSRAEGTAGKESDYDFILVSGKFEGKKFHERPAQLYHAWNLDAPADFVCLTPKEFESKAKRVSIVSHALKHGITII